MHKTAALLLLALPAFLLAQETPTEREAAREVLKKMGELERSLDVPGFVQRFTAPNPAREEVVQRAKELMDRELLALGDDITKHPEIGFQEKRSVQKLTDYLQSHRFEIQMGTPGLDTAGGGACVDTCMLPLVSPPAACQWSWPG